MSFNFGALLKTAREEKNISLAQVSEALKLSIDKIEDIEASNVKNLPPAAFTCGYLRLFSKLVAVDENEIIEIYYQAIGEVPDNVLPSATSDIPLQADSKHPGMKLVSFSVVILIVILSIVWWNDRGVDEEGPADTSIAAEKNTDDGLDAPVDETVPEEVVGDKAESEELTGEQLNDSAPLVEADVAGNEKPQAETEVELPVAEKTAAEDPVQVEVIENQDKTDAIYTQKELLAESVGAEKSLDQAEENIKLARMASPVAEVGVDTVQLLAVDDCWVEILDANDHLLYFSLLKKNEEVHLSGQEPFKVFLGKANAVEIKLNDIKYDVSSFVRSNQVARFTMSMVEARKMQSSNN